LQSNQYIKQKKFAVKVFDKNKLYEQEKGLLSIFNELKIMRDLTTSQYIIKLFEVFQSKDQFFFVLELIEGIKLQDYIDNQKKLPEYEIKRILYMILKGIQYLHQKNIIHRDLKLENIIYQKETQTLKIIDFGLSTYTYDIPYIFPKCGTPGYVAPEIANQIDKNLAQNCISDIFSTGVIFHNLLFGENLFKGVKFNHVLAKNKDCVINFQEQKYDNISPEAKELLKWFLQKDPQKRIPCQVALDLLNPLLGKLPQIFSWKESQIKFFTGLVNSSNSAGAALGSISAGYFSALYGRRTLFMIGDVFCIIGSGLGLIQNTASLVLGRFIQGIGMGILVNLAILFIVEWTYYKYRGYAGAPMVCFTPLGFIFSSLLGLNTENVSDQYWRIVLGIPGIISCVGFGLSISPIYPVVLSENLPEVGYMITSILFWGLNTGIVQFFPILVDSELKLYGIFWMFGGIMLINFFLTIGYMKETKGKSLIQIDNMYNLSENKNDILPKNYNIQDEQKSSEGYI
ncbi:protein kinase domain protein, partial [Ichthyophthirius multifiliis]